MKVVILAGGLGTRMREETEFKPKPMVLIGGKPVIWHIMKVYSYFGYNEFIICTGYKSESIKNYFLNYKTQNNDFTVETKTNTLTFHNRDSKDVEDWKVTLVDTGEQTLTGGRVKQIQKYIEEDNFMCTYGDGIADVEIEKLLKLHFKNPKIATISVTKPVSRFGVVELNSENNVTGFLEKPRENTWINIGFFIFNYKIFDYLNENSILESEVLKELANESQINAYKHDSFWHPMDTFRESQYLNELWNKNLAPWSKFL